MTEADGFDQTVERLKRDLAARDAELAALTLQFSEMRRRWQLRDLYATQQEERAEAAERERDAAWIELQRHKAGFPGGWTEELQRQIEFRHNAERDRDEWKRKAEEAARGKRLLRECADFMAKFSEDCCAESADLRQACELEFTAIAAKGEA